MKRKDFFNCIVQTFPMHCSINQALHKCPTQKIRLYQSDPSNGIQGGIIVAPKLAYLVYDLSKFSKFGRLRGAAGTTKEVSGVMGNNNLGADTKEGTLVGLHPSTNASICIMQIKSFRK